MDDSHEGIPSIFTSALVVKSLVWLLTVGVIRRLLTRSPVPQRPVPSKGLAHHPMWVRDYTQLGSNSRDTKGQVTREHILRQLSPRDQMFHSLDANNRIWRHIGFESWSPTCQFKSEREKYMISKYLLNSLSRLNTCFLVEPKIFGKKYLT